MGRVKMDSTRYQKIYKKILAGVPVIKIAELEGCSERTVRLIRDQKMMDPAQVSKQPVVAPLWSENIDWEIIYSDVVNGGHCLSDVWQERSLKVSYSQFTRYFNQRFPLLKQKISTPRFFAPGERVEVDFSGKKPEWINTNTGEVFSPEVFVSCLGFSQKVFACAVPSQKVEDFIDCHNKMFKYYGGVPKILVPDNLKSGVVKTDLYDPKINVAYEDMANHYSTVVVPARSYKPKDKSLAEGGVKLIMRTFRFIYRRHTFTSQEEINKALLVVCDKINNRTHSRFKVSRNKRFDEIESKELKPCPELPYELAKFKEAKVHPDSHIQIDHNYYSVPHELRGQNVRVRMTSREISVFKDLERVAHHQRLHRKKGLYSTVMSHLPEKSRAYLETTPQNILSQAKFLNKDLADIIHEMFEEKGALESLRRAQGLVRAAHSEIKCLGSEKAKLNISKAVKQMKDFNRVRSFYFREVLKSLRYTKTDQKTSAVVKRSENSNLRHTEIKPTHKGETDGISTNEKHNARAQATWDV